MNETKLQSKTPRPILSHNVAILSSQGTNNIQQKSSNNYTCSAKSPLRFCAMPSSQASQANTKRTGRYRDESDGLLANNENSKEMKFNVAESNTSNSGAIIQRSLPSYDTPASKSRLSDLNSLYFHDQSSKFGAQRNSTGLSNEANQRIIKVQKSSINEINE